jgi:hypothetical protein
MKSAIELTIELGFSVIIGGCGFVSFAVCRQTNKGRLKTFPPKGEGLYPAQWKSTLI